MVFDKVIVLVVSDLGSSGSYAVPCRTSMLVIVSC